jgi:hypothetical protein
MLCADSPSSLDPSRLLSDNMRALLCHCSTDRDDIPRVHRHLRRDIHHRCGSSSDSDAERVTIDDVRDYANESVVGDGHGTPRGIHMDSEWDDAVRSSKRRLRSALEYTDDLRTYPTTYMWFGGELSGYLAGAQSLPISTKCSTGKGVEITLPLSADPSSLVAIVGTTFFGQQVSSTSSVPYPSLIPSSIIGYLDTLPEVQQQFNDIPVTSCAYFTPQPARCIVVETSTSTSCVSGSGNLTSTHCTEKAVTVTTTRARATEDRSLSESPPFMTNGPVLVPRRPAAYLTYNTLPLSDDAAGAALDQATQETTSIKSDTRSKQTGSRVTFERLPSITTEEETPKDSNPTSAPGEATHTVESQPAEVVISALISLVTASQNEVKTAETEGTTEDSHTDDAGNQQPASGGTADHSDTQSIGNLMSALQVVGSQAVVTSQGLAATRTPQDPSNVQSPSNTGQVEPPTESGSSEDASRVALSTTATGPLVSGTTSNVMPIFTFQGQTITAGSAVTFEGNVVSQLPNADGVVIDSDHTVLLPDGEATTLSQQGSQQPVTISRSGSAFIVNGQTIPADQEITAGQTTQTVTAGGAVAFGGNAVSQLPNHDGVVVNQDRTVLLSNGGATTLPQQDSQQPITVSRSGTEFIVDGKTVPANQEITVGQTTASASVSGSSAVLYVNGTSVPQTATANVGESSRPSTGVGGYINSGIGGDGASPSSDGSSANATDDTVAPSTGDGPRASLLDWSCGSWAAGLFAFLSVVCLL